MRVANVVTFGPVFGSFFSSVFGRKKVMNHPPDLALHRVDELRQVEVLLLVRRHPQERLPAAAVLHRRRFQRRTLREG